MAKIPGQQAPVPDGARAVAMLRELAALTSDSSGAQRAAWTGTWQRARAFLRDQLRDLPVQVSTDAAGNLWARLPGGAGAPVIIGSHLDSVPHGGWLDGAYGVMCAVEVLHALAARQPLPRPVLLVDWADEEGRFGYSLFGSSAAAGNLDVAAVAGLADAAGRRLPEVLAEHGVVLDNAAQARQMTRGAHAYLEAHIEQGPVLEAEGLALAAVTGTVGVERHRVTFAGQAAHAGSTPMGRRRDAFLAAAATALAVRAAAVRQGGVGTVGSVSLQPGIPTAVPGTAAMVIDQRHPEAGGLQSMLDTARTAARDAAAAEGCTVTWQPVFRARPQPFAAELVGIARRACAEITGRDRALVSWALHDATQMAAVVPTAMIFTSSTAGLSHARGEDTPAEHLRLGVQAFYRAVCEVAGLGTGPGGAQKAG